MDVNRLKKDDDDVQHVTFIQIEINISVFEDYKSIVLGNYSW